MIQINGQALEIDPTNVATLNNKGYALSKLGKYNESIALYDKALEVDLTYVLALNNKNTRVSITRLTLLVLNER
jgi:tetratricopeptide (TPR) repeat protein